MARRSRDRALSLAAAAGLLAISLGVFALVRLLEGGGIDLLADPTAYLRSIDHDVAADRISSAAELVAGVLAILITVVAIVVELAANRYTHRITQLFIREPLNAAVMGLLVLTTILCLWLSSAPPPVSPDRAWLPGASLLVCMTLVTLCVISLFPYLSFLFRFISPLQVIERIREQAERGLGDGRGRDLDAARARVIEATEELEDVARGARDGSDRGIAMASIDALAEFIEHYAARKDGLPPAWFTLSDALRRDPDFVAMDRSALELIDARGCWLEVKVLRQYAALFGESLGQARDIASLITLNTRRLAESGCVPLELSLQFFNSFMRATINARDPRTAYYVLNQYRMLAESRMSTRDPDAVTRIAGHLRYYGRLGYDTAMPFLLEVVAYDIGLLVEAAAGGGHGEVDALLDLLLEVDTEAGRDEQEAPVRGVRRAQIQLAAFFLERGDEPRARRIFDDLSDDPPERLSAIREELMAETNPQYREFTDRGVNFSYLEPARRAQLDRFFGWWPAR